MRRRFLGEIKAKNNVLYYTSTDNLIIVPYRSNFGTIMINNEMSNNIGVMTFLADITTIGEYAFSDCNRLKSITIPASVTSIGSYAFRGCTSLTSITIPDGVTLIENGTFYNCDSLTSMTIPNSVTLITSYAFQYCTSLTSITIPDNVTLIGNYAFNSCSSLTSITIPDSVTTIEAYAFYNCTSLTSVYCKATKPPVLDGLYVFDYNGSSRKIYVPYQSLDVYKTAGWSRYADDIVGYDFENDKIYPFPITLEYGSLYPEVTQYLMDKYGLNYGTIKNPLPIEETVMLGDSYTNSTGSGVVKYISTDDTWNSSVSLKLYLENHGNTYYCVTLNTTQNSDFGHAGQYFYD